mgnify:CR=1 FL=1
MDREKIIDCLNATKFSKKDFNISYRALNHYSEHGLIFENRQSKSSWRKLNGFDAIWLETLILLRSIGISVDNIRRVKKNIFQYGSLGIVDKASYLTKSFHDEIVDSIFYEHKLYLVIFHDMTYSFHDSSTSKQWKDYKYKDLLHLNIPLRGIIMSVYRRASI